MRPKTAGGRTCSPTSSAMAHDANFDVRFGLVLDMIFTAPAGQQAQERAGDHAAVSQRGRVVDNLIDCAVGSLVATAR